MNSAIAACAQSSRWMEASLVEEVVSSVSSVWVNGVQWVQHSKGFKRIPLGHHLGIIRASVCPGHPAPRWRTVYNLQECTTNWDFLHRKSEKQISEFPPENSNNHRTELHTIAFHRGSCLQVLMSWPMEPPCMPARLATLWILSQYAIF
jgi:hypothetical protein